MVANRCFKSDETGQANFPGSSWPCVPAFCCAITSDGLMLSGMGGTGGIPGEVVVSVRVSVTR